MNNHFMTRDMVNRMFSEMRNQKVSTSYLCKALGIHYRDFVSMCEGKVPCYNKWQKKIAEALGVDRESLFFEFCSSKENLTHQK